MSDSVCWFWIFLMSPLPGMLFIKIIWNYCSCALLQRSNQLWQMQTITLPLWYYPSESEGNSLCYTMAWPLKFHCLFPPPVIVPIVWVRRVMADLELGQSLDRGWLLQGSTPSDAKAAWGLNGSQPRHLDTKDTCVCYKTADKILRMWFCLTWTVIQIPEDFFRCAKYSNFLKLI